MSLRSVLDNTSLTTGRRRDVHNKVLLYISTAGSLIYPLSVNTRFCDEARSFVSLTVTLRLFPSVYIGWRGRSWRLGPPQVDRNADAQSDPTRAKVFFQTDEIEIVLDE